MRRSIVRWPWLLALLFGLPGCGSGEDERPAYLQRLEAFTPHFTYSGPSPQSFTDEEPPDGVKVIRYVSGDMPLKAWVARPEHAADEKLPGVVYIHGGFAFGMGDFADAQPFLDAGFVVMAPSLRGENGNPGNFELLLGEVEDAAAALRWLASQPYVDASKVYVFGHSTGGAISALLSLRAGLPAVHTGSAGGLYPRDTFEGWRDFVPFDPDRDGERDVRLLLGNLRWMQMAHFAFLGRSDSLAASKSIADEEAASTGSRLVVTLLPGDHFSSLPTAVEAYIGLIAGEKP